MIQSLFLSLTQEMVQDVKQDHYPLLFTVYLHNKNLYAKIADTVLVVLFYVGYICICSFCLLCEAMIKIEQL